MRTLENLRMSVTIDTSALIAVIGNEKSKQKIIDITVGCSLYAPASVHWEIGNALSSMFQRRGLSLDCACTALEAYQEIPIRFIDVPLKQSIALSQRLNIYAYDAYLIQCALQTNTSLLTLDNYLLLSARQVGVACLEV
jgi:predicted nucleic acid-binding protein